MGEALRIQAGAEVNELETSPREHLPPGGYLAHHVLCREGSGAIGQGAMKNPIDPATHKGNGSGNGSAKQAAPFLRIRNLVKRFGAFTALQDVSLDVYRGEFVCFLGPSGCGKTTLLRAIAGLDPQDEGTIEINGRDVSKLPPAARDFGIVFQSYALFPNLPVAANVGYGLVTRRAGRAAIDRRVAELLALVGLTEQGAK